MKYIFQNRRQISTSLHGVMFKNTVILTSIKIQNLIEEEHQQCVNNRCAGILVTLTLFLLYVIYKDFCVLVCYDVLCDGRKSTFQKNLLPLFLNDGDKYSTKRRFITRRSYFRSILERAGCFETSLHLYKGIGCHISDDCTFLYHKEDCNYMSLILHCMYRAS